MTRVTLCSEVSNRRRLLAVALSAVLTGTIGCSGVADQPELGLVTGTVTLDESPVPGVAVTFRPDGGRPAMGTTDAHGNYQLTYIRDTPGCMVGLCRVEIGYGEESGEDEDLDGDDVVQEPLRTTRREAIPARYNGNSELEEIVEPGQNIFHFDLTS